MTREELKAIMAIAFSQYPEIAITQPRFDAWWAHCEKVSIEVGRRAVDMLTLMDTYGPPKIAHFMQCVKKIHDAANPQKQLTEGEAWGALMGAVKSYGWPNPGDAFDYLRKIDPHLAQVAAQFGWRNICEWETKDNAINKAHWWKCIASLKARQERYEELGIQEDPNKIGNSDKRISETVQQLLPKMGMN